MTFKKSLAMQSSKILALSLFMAPCIANASYGVALKATTLGLGAEFSYNVNEQVSIAASYNGFNYDYDTEENNVDYEGEINFSSLTVEGRYHPWSNGFFLAGGLLFNDNEINLDAVPKSGGTFDFNGQTYTTSQIGSATANITFPDVAPLLSLGWRSVSDGFSFFTQVGVAITGSPEIDTTVVCAQSVPSPVCTNIKSDVEAERQDLQKDLDELKFWPVIGLGMQYIF